MWKVVVGSPRKQDGEIVGTTRASGGEVSEDGDVEVVGLNW